jgi:hypothetical protein
MNAPEGPAAPESGTTNPDEIPEFEDLAADPEIAALLDFEPVPRKVMVADGWTAAAQREFIARLAAHGSPSKACDELGKNRTGVTKLYKSPFGASFRAAWDGAVELAVRRRAELTQKLLVGSGASPPSLDHRRKLLASAAGPLPGQVLNELGQWEYEDSLQRRMEDALDSIRMKLLSSRRLYLKEISNSPGKRAAFEILTELPIDWKKARRMEAQADEPWRKPNMHSADMLLTAESGWMGGMVPGRDKLAELRKAVDEHRAKEGKPPVEWDGE